LLRTALQGFNDRERVLFEDLTADETSFEVYSNALPMNLNENQNDPNVPVERAR